MGELKIQKSLTIKEAALARNKSQAWIRKYIRLGVIDVECFNGRPVKPYKIIESSLDALFTVASVSSLKTRDMAKVLGRKPSKKEAFQWPK
jgi:hypothetical protein